MNILEALSAAFGGWFANKVLSTDHQDDPVYRAKLQELIERNKTFEEARNRSDGSGSGSNEQHS